ncbi:hypothetical protein MPSEU_000269200 [Mayamaea pseudoterrestris]|nr:hypothetical protein MPSEU_000269200 [Mayamaea pseudoterrestris]
MPPSLSTFLWKHVFTAFLPPLEPDDIDYYAVLSLPTSPAPSTDDVRKAYRKLSLELHPDKIAQRGGGTNEQEEARVKYEAVQRAYGVLVDPKTRAQYNEWRPSSTRYQFVSDSQWLHPAPLFENLTQASLFDKTRLILLVAIFLLALLVQPILICVKVNQIVNDDARNNGRLEDAPWLLLLLPLWCFGAIVLLFWTALAVMTKSSVVVLTGLENAAWLAGCVVLACIWDGVVESVNWYVAAIPFYIGLLLRTIKSLLSIRTAHHEQEKMVSPDYHRKLMHDYRELLAKRDSATDEERGSNVQLSETERNLLEKYPTEELYIDHLQEAYVVVTLNEEAYAAAVTLMELPDETGQVHLVTDEEKEILQVSMSHEYIAMEEAVQEQRRSMYIWIAVGISFVTLVAYKLQSSPDASWWSIFAPFWVYFTLTLFNACFVCCCVNVSGEQVTLHPGGGHGSSSEDADDTLTEEKDLKANRSVAFATPEGQMDDFNNESISFSLVVDDAKSDGKQEAVATGFSSPANLMPGSIDPVDSGASKELKEPSLTDDTPVVANVLKSGDSSKPDFGGEGESRPVPVPVAEDNPDTPGASSNEPDIDFEAAYHAWQAAHAQAEQSAMDQQVKTVRTCCSSILQLIIVCCIVGKLQDSSEGESGYNALWILFPVFLITGIVLGCCSCFIYSANPDSLNIITERTKKDHEGDSNTGDNASQGHNDQSTAVVIAPKAETATTHVPGDVEAAAASNTDQLETAPDDVDGATMDDLD